MKKIKELSLFLPVYNEEENISPLVDNILKVIGLFSENFEIIIVNDGSTDKTKEVSETLAKKFENVRVVSHDTNRGYGAALKTGFSNARYEYVFFTDGDSQFNIAEISKLIPLISNSDIAAGFRIKRNDPLHRIINGKAYNALIHLLFDLNIRDIDCAFKIIKKNVLDSITLKSESQFVSAELLIKAKKKGFTIRQAGVNHLPREKGSSSGNNPLVVIRSFKELFKLWKELK